MALGAYRVTGISISAMLLSTFGGTIFTGFVEELLIRGSVFQLGEELLGPWSALMLSAVLYGALMRLTQARALGVPQQSRWRSTSCLVRQLLSRNGSRYLRDSMRRGTLPRGDNILGHLFPASQP